MPRHSTDQSALAGTDIQTLLNAITGYHFGQERYASGGLFGPVKSSYLTLCCVLEGAIRIVVDERMTIRLEAGECKLFYNRESTVYSYPYGQPTHAAWLESKPDLAADTVTRLLATQPPRMSMSARLSTLLQTGLSFQEENQRTPQDRTLNNSLGHAVMSAYLYEAHRDPEAVYIPAAARLALRFIQNEYMHPLSLEVIARQVQVSEQYLIKTFRQCFDMTPMRYLWHLRTLAGIEALRRTQDTVTEISLRCGYQTPYHFSRHVKQLTGLSPTAIRSRETLEIGSEAALDILNIHF